MHIPVDTCRLTVVKSNADVKHLCLVWKHHSLLCVGTMDKFLDLPPVKIPRPKVSYNCNLNSSCDSQDGRVTDIMDTELVWVNMRTALHGDVKSVN